MACRALSGNTVDKFSVATFATAVESGDEKDGAKDAATTEDTFGKTFTEDAGKNESINNAEIAMVAAGIGRIVGKPDKNDSKGLRTAGMVAQTKSGRKREENQEKMKDRPNGTIGMRSQA